MTFISNKQYQENPNQNLYSGSWSPTTNFLDGNWGTYSRCDSGDCYLYVNYTKPTGSTSSQWRVKDEDNNILFSLSSDCFNYYENKIRLKIERVATRARLDFWCYYGGTWNIIGLTTSAQDLYEENMTWTVPQVTYTQTYMNTYSPGDVVTWNIKTCASDGVCSFAPLNYTFTLDLEEPSINVLYPTSTVNYGKNGGTLNLNVSVTDDNLDDCWYNYNGTNVTYTCNTNTTITLGTSKTLTYYVNDTVGNLASEVITWDYKVFENSRTHNTTTYETAYETYQINLTANSSLTAVRLNYNGTLYSMTNQGSGIWSYSRDLPSSVIGNNSINFRFTYAGDTINTNYETYQDVDLIQFGLCNATLTNDFVKYSFKDETDLSDLNVSIQYSSWDYYLGTGTQTKEYLFSNTTENDDYTFCFTPTTKILKVEPTINYLSTDYPTRVYPPGLLTLTSVVTNYVLYLLGVNDGIYTTFITTTSSNTIVTGADILITRDISGVTTTVGQGTTDGAGSATFFLNPNYIHTVTASKTGYGSSITTITPTQSTYTIVLSSTSNYTYISNTAGLLWSFFPGVGILNQSNNNFGFNISSELANIVGCKIEILSKDKTTVLTSGEYLTSNASICSVTVNYEVNGTYPQIKGRLLVDLGDGYQILEEDAFWISLSVNSTGLTLTNWFNGLKTFDLRYFIGETDEIKTQHREYTQILLFFLIATIICSVLNQLGWDIQTSGGMIFILGGLVWVASIVGFLTLISISPFSFIDKYFVAFIYTFFMIGYATRSFS